MEKQKLLDFLTTRFNENRGNGSYESQVKCHEMMLLIELTNSGEFDKEESA